MLQQIAQKIMACCRRLCGGKKAVVVLSEVSLFDGNIGGYFCFLHRDLKRQKKTPIKTKQQKRQRNPKRQDTPTPKPTHFLWQFCAYFSNASCKFRIPHL